MSDNVIEAHGLTKRYGHTIAVAGIDLTVKPGEVIGLLGPNGAGKTTTILMLLGLTEANEGHVDILGKDPLRQPLEVKHDVGYLPDSVGFYDNMTGRENLAYTASLAGLSREQAREAIAAAFDKVRLTDVADNKVASYSHGMKKRLGIAELLMRDCRVAILDEPTSGLDPRATHDLLELIRQLSGEGMTILLSSHALDAVQSVCHRIALFNKGRIGFIGTTEELAARLGGGSFIVDVEADDIDLAKAAKSTKGVKSVASTGEGRWQVEAAQDVRPEISRLVINGGGALRNMDLRRIRLDEAYNRYFTEYDNES